MTYHPTDELVAVAWLKTIPALGDGVATTLPTDTATWPTLGTPAGPIFVQITIVGGAVELEYNRTEAIIGVACWAASPTSGKPPWGRASQVAALVRDAATSQRGGGVVTMPVGYGPAVVETVYPASPPRRILSDPADYARYDLDLNLRWIEV